MKKSSISLIIFVFIGTLFCSCEEKNSLNDFTDQPSEVVQTKGATGAHSSFTAEVIDDYTIRYQVSISQAGTSNTETYENVFLMIRYYDNYFNGTAMEVGEHLISFGNITLNPGETFSQTGTINADTRPYYMRGGWVVFRDSYKFKLENELWLPY